jgi:hypothetical protein
MGDGWRDPAEALAGYERWLVGLPLSERTRREYAALEEHRNEKSR